MARISRKSMQTKVKAATPGSGNQVWSPMGEMNVGDSATIRLIPFEDQMTGGFWTAQKLIQLKFVNPDDDAKFWTYTVPCLEMYEPAGTVKCPVADESRKLFKEADELKAAGDTKGSETIINVALAHWLRYSYYFQGFILKGGNEQKDPNVLEPLKFPKSMFTGINTAVMDDEAGFETLPCGEFDMSDVEHMLAGEIPDDADDEDEFLNRFVGRNYIVRKTKKGDFNNYETSTWEMKESSLTDEQMEYIGEHGLIDLSAYLPKRPTPEMYETFAEMARVSIDFALGDGDGEWNPEWEEVGGIKPNKGREENTSGGSSSKGALKDRIANKMKSNKDNDEGDSSDVRNKLKSSRGATKASKAVESSEDSVSDDAPTETTDTPANDRVAKMKARIAEKKAKAKAKADA